MINEEDLKKQKRIYTRNGEGEWKVAAYCPVPSVTMVEINTGEKCDFGLGGLTNKTFETIRELSDHELLHLRIGLVQACVSMKEEKLLTAIKLLREARRPKVEYCSDELKLAKEAIAVMENNIFNAIHELKEGSPEYWDHSPEASEESDN